MFLVEGLLASIVGVWAYWYLDNKPGDAKWLTDAEKTELSTAISAEEHHKSDHSPESVLTALGSPKVLYLSLIYLIIQMSVYGLVFYLPTQVANLLGRNVGLTVGLVTAIPWVCALVAAYLIPRFYAPELNDIEGVWRDLKRHHLAHQTFNGPDDLDRAIHEAVGTLNTERNRHPLANHRIAA